MRDDPPSDAGTDQARAICWLLGMAVRPCGAEGTVEVLAGVTVVEDEFGELPARFVAKTTKVYGVAFVRLGTEMKRFVLVTRTLLLSVELAV